MTERVRLTLVIGRAGAESESESESDELEEEEEEVAGMTGTVLRIRGGYQKDILENIDNETSDK